MKARHSPLIVGAGVSAVAACGYLLNPWSLPDTLIYSQFFHWRGARPFHEDLVILAIDEDSLRVGELFEPEELAELPELAQLQTWPWPRAVYGMALEQLMQAGAQQVAFDLIFVDPSSFGSEDDQAFRQALERHAEQVTLGMKPQVFHSAQVEGVTAEVVETGLPVVDLRVPELKLGHVDMVIAPNQKLLLLPQPLNQGDTLIPPFAAAIANRFPPPPPVGINYRGPSQSVPTYSFWMLFEPSFWQFNLGSGAVFQDKIVLIGGTTELAQDIHSTPLDVRMPGVEVQANAVATLLEGDGIRWLPRHLAVPLILGLGVGMGGLLFNQKQVGGKLGLTVLAGPLILGGSYLTFLHTWMFPTTALLSTVLVTGLIDTTALGIREQLDRLRLRRILAKRVSAAVLEEILNQPEIFAQSLGGRVSQAAILFSDIRGFTTLSSQIDAQELVALLNRYFACMVTPILEQQGIIDKFIGDAIMAEFGVPLMRDERTEALASVQAALGMRRALHALRIQLQAEGKPLIFHGIGINIGEVVAGNLGSPEKLEYTVIGDAVNVASRIEGLTKELQFDIIISQSVYELVQEEIQATCLGTYPIRGKQEPATLYGVVDTRSGDGKLCQQVREEFSAYQMLIGRTVSKS